MSKVPLRDLIVVLPGATGSVLQKEGKDMWNFSGQAFYEFITTLGNDLQSLRLENDDPLDIDERHEGIKATALISGAHLIPGLVKIDGYADLIGMILSRFNVTVGNINEPNEQANFFPFPYDWRRDCRVAAHQLKRFLDRQLPLWRRSIEQEQARVILIAHSMGGLVSRYYLEVLEGWRDCRALITYGTPYRGSLEALGYLANGYKKLFVDLTEVVRSFPSVYQLLPIYPVVRHQEAYHRAAELEDIPHIDHVRAKAALAFHRTIEEAVNAHRNDPVYLREGYKIIPVVGTRQPTYQSSPFAQQQLTLSRDLPGGVDPLLADGDGVVPRVSAIPIELSEEYYDTFVPEQHGSLQSNETMLDELYERLKQMQVRGQQAVRNPVSSPAAARHSAISLDLEDLYVKGSEPVELRANLVNMPRSAGVLRAEIQALGNTSVPRSTRPFHRLEGGWVLSAEDLPVGIYRVTAFLDEEGSRVPSPVHGLFEIAQ